MTKKKRDKIFVTPALVCPMCGHKMDRSSLVEVGNDPPTPPKPGDVSLCIRCGFAAVFAEKGLRKPTGEELLQFATNKTIIEGQIMIAGLPEKPR